MGLLTKAPRGTQDLLGKDSRKWRAVEEILMRTATGAYGFQELRTPTFEHTELFQRGVGDTTDVVQKEMYTFEDKARRSITLRPEGTAGVVRAVLENNLLENALPYRCCYLTNCFRYEKPQAGRLREFHQFGAEVFGPASPNADAELICLVLEQWRNLGVTGLDLHLNSIGCPDCRKEYHRILREYLQTHKESLCDTCKDRMEKNPMRVLDCKSPVCRDVVREAPVMLDHLCPDCREHFEGLKTRLDALEIPYIIDTHIVRGLDYYTRTVFEFVSAQTGETVLGGGRYDGLVEELGGSPTPALGFAFGMERLMKHLDDIGVSQPGEPPVDVYIATMGDAAQIKAQTLCRDLRAIGVRAECDGMGRSLKAQMKYAGKTGARFTVVLGDNELSEDRCTLKNMDTGETAELQPVARLLERFRPESD